MWMLSFRWKKQRVVWLLVAVAAGLACLVGWRLIRTGQQTTLPATASSVQQVDPKVTCEADRIAYLQAFGWQIDPQPLQVKQVVIPDPLDAVYQQYNALQKTQGFDLQRYTGRLVQAYSYLVTNYPGQKEIPVHANLLIYEQKVIAADISSVELDGFMHGLQLP